jgi:selenocysteine-specific elongation factor
MAVIATAGHVDHGKSSLIRVLTGTDPDRLAEEQRKGMTIDLGFAHCVTPDGVSLSFVDVPGHIDFIRTMIAGINAVDIVMLIVDANEGWMPQTQEHLDILDIMHVPSGVVVLTKCDKVSAEQIELVEADIGRRLDHSRMAWSGIVRTSATTGVGINALISHIENLVVAATAHESTSPARLFIDRVFTIRGAGTVVTGTLEGSPVSIGDDLQIARTRQIVRVREVQTLDASVSTCPPRSRCALNLVGADTATLRRGDALITPESFFMTSTIDVMLDVVTSLQQPLTKRGSFTVHLGTHSQSATLRVKNGDSIAPGSQAAVRLHFAEPLPLAIADLVLVRDTGISATVGGGAVSNLDPRHKLHAELPEDSIAIIMSGRGFVPIQEARILTGQNLSPVVGQWFALDDVFAECTRALRQQLERTGSVALASLQPYERDVISMFDDVRVISGVAVLGSDDPLLQHPYVEMFKTAGVTTPDTSSLDRNIIRQLVHKKVLYEHDGIAFHVDTLTGLRGQLQELWAANSNGFTMAQLRDALGITRKHALPIATSLDKIGFTKRAGDLRVPGSAW